MMEAGVPINPNRDREFVVVKAEVPRTPAGIRCSGVGRGSCDLSWDQTVVVG